MSERDLIATIQALFPRAGDDAAVIGSQLYTADVLVETIDFTRDTPLRLVARKSLVVNLSDIAAMGGRPLYALAAIGAPDDAIARTLIEELAKAATEQHVEIVGGDLSRAEQIFISITVIGEAAQPILRSGARKGDRIYLSRPIGGSAAGLTLLQHRREPADYAEREFIESAIRRHLEPDAEVALGLKLAGVASSCIDLSDGLSTDLDHLCTASMLGAMIESERVPVFPDLPRYGPRLGINVRDAVFHGGEEYALLFTSSLRESELSALTGRPVYAIGRMTEEPGVRLNGEILAPKGFDHFA
jgi:thiamine-monophosphate kinase